MIEIELVNGRGIMVIDDDDLPLLGGDRWCLWVHGMHRYAIRSANRNQEFAHRVIMRPPPGLVVDHINGDGLDNRRANLRVVTQSHNQRNRRASRTGTSQYLGVHKVKSTGHWEATISPGGRTIHLGTFIDERDAALAYDLAAREMYGEFANPNLPELVPER